MTDQVLVEITNTVAQVEIAGVPPHIEVVAPEPPEVEIATMGVRGPAGAAGEPYQHDQSVASDEWIVNHNLGRRPGAVSVLSPGFVEVDAEVIHLNGNQTRIKFAQPQTGFVRLV